MKRFDLLVLGFPIPQGRPRVFTPKGDKFPVATDPPKSRKWKEEIRYAAQKKIEETGHQIWKEMPLYINLTFYVPRPKSLPKRIQQPMRRPDLDNLEKAVMDALQGMVYDDDSRIVLKISEKVFHPEGKIGVAISISEAKWDAPSNPGAHEREIAALRKGRSDA